MSKPESRRAMDSAIGETQQLGRDLEQTDAGTRIKRDFNMDQNIR